MKRFLFLCVLLGMSSSPMTSWAQSSVKNVLSNLFSSSSSTSNSSNVISSVFNNLIGNKTVSSESLTGTWTYTQPAVAFESDNLLSKAGGAITAQTIEKKLGDGLSKYGYKAGYSSITFNSDSTFSAKINNKTVSGKYSVSESTITLYSKLGTKIVTANVAIASNQLQITFKANKLLEFVKYASSLSSTSGTLDTVSKLAGSYSGMQIGLQFQKS